MAANSYNRKTTFKDGDISPCLQKRRVVIGPLTAEGQLQV